MKRLEGSKFGEGTGGPVEATDDPNNPSFDPASHKTGSDTKIRWLLDENNIERLTTWEKDFLLAVYGQVPLSRRQHIRIGTIYKRCQRASQ